MSQLVRPFSRNIFIGERERVSERERRDNRQEEARRRAPIAKVRDRILFEMHAYDSMEFPIEFVLIPATFHNHRYRTLV